MMSHNRTEPDLIAEYPRFTVRLWEAFTTPDPATKAESAAA